MSYRDTLSEKDAHLARRLEGFGDVVFGFSVSQLALQLSLPQTPADLISNPIRYAFYFATFAALAGYWLRFHKMLSGAFRPAPIDLIAVFFFLAFIGLVPYALYANSHFAMDGSPRGAQLGFAAYFLCISMLSIASVAVTARNFRRGYFLFDALERRKTWESTVTSGVLAVTCLFALTIDLTAGIAAGGIAATLLAFGTAASRRLARVPSAALLRLPSPPAAPEPNPAKAPAG